MQVVVDIIIIVILLFFLISGIKRGLLRQVLQVVGIAAAFIGAFYFAHHLAAYLQGRFDLAYQISLVIAAVVLFVGIILLFNFAGLAMQKLARVTLLGPLDRIGGAVFGLIKGALLVSLLLVIILSIPLPGAVREELASDPLVAVTYPVLPVLFNFVLSHSSYGPYFEANLDRVRGSDAVIKAKRAMGGVKTKLEDGT